MPYQLLLFPLFLLCTSCMAQNVVAGRVFNGANKQPLPNVIIDLEGHSVQTVTDETGVFAIEAPSAGHFILNLTLPDYYSKRMPIELEGRTLDLGAVFLERDITTEQTDNLITLTESEIIDDEIGTASGALLQATRDIFLNRAAFDFGQAFFRVRGYDSQNGEVLLNGIPMNKFYDGRPQWNHWGGLNDVTRNQLFTHGIQASEFTFGGILGNTNIDTRPSKLRPGTRLSSSVSNRTYAGRLMATHTSKTNSNGLTYSVSASRRWAKQGYIEGTLYDAYSVFGALEYQLNKRNTLLFTGILASNRRGRSSAITEEVFALFGKRYNPYWGFQNGQIRNSRERKIAEPIVMFNHLYRTQKLNVTTAIAYQFGESYRSRLGYFNAPNPDPVYYRYMPSFYINSPIGANFESANTAKNALLLQPQLNWQRVYQANAMQDRAHYVVYDEVTKDGQVTANLIGNLQLTNALHFDFGLRYRQLRSQNFARIHDLLGAAFHDDIDPFSNTLNNSQEEVSKKEQEVFNYHYLIENSQIGSFAQIKYYRPKWNAFLAAKLDNTNYRRNGRFQNERFPEQSLGNSEPLSFDDFGFKTGFTYRLNGRHQFVSNGAVINRPPTVQNAFVNPRESNALVPDLRSETISTADINYFIRLPKVTGRLSAFYTRFQHTTDVNFFFVDSGVGSDFVQEVVTDLDKLHKGLELGLEYEVSSSVKVSAVAAMGSYTYASNPSVSINFDTAGAEENFINPKGNLDLGEAAVQGYKLAQGPQNAFALGIHYRDPKYWWIGASLNYLADNYANISTITRTASFLLDPDTGTAFPGATEENVNALLAQRPLDNFYLLNLIGGKSWLTNGRYISVFASVNNLFDAVFRTGGFEQSRNGNFGQLQQDNLSGSPSFAPKFWYGYGRTFFLNLAISF